MNRCVRCQSAVALRRTLTPKTATAMLNTMSAMATLSTRTTAMRPSIASMSTRRAQRLPQRKPSLDERHALLQKIHQTVNSWDRVVRRCVPPQIARQPRGKVTSTIPVDPSFSLPTTAMTPSNSARTKAVTLFITEPKKDLDLLRLSDSRQSKSTPNGHDDRERDINIGRAILVLQHDVPHFFLLGLSDTSIYHKDLTFIDPHHHLSPVLVRGRTQYVVLAAILRAVLRFYYDGIDVALVSVKDESPSADPSDHRSSTTRKFIMRWVFEATPRWKILRSILFGWIDVPADVYEGVFEYRFGQDGRVHTHVVRGVEPCPPLLRMCRWWFLNLGHRSGTGGSHTTPREQPDAV